MTNEEMERDLDEAEKLLDEHVAKLMEHWENVQIFCSRTVDGGQFTCGVNRGAGNYYAREGQVRQWLTEEDEVSRRMGRKKGKG